MAWLDTGVFRSWVPCSGRFAWPDYPPPKVGWREVSLLLEVTCVAGRYLSSDAFELVSRPMRQPTDGNARPPGREKDEEEWQPSPEYALEHIETSLDQECDDDNVHDDHDAHKCNGGAEWRP